MLYKFCTIKLNFSGRVAHWGYQAYLSCFQVPVYYYLFIVYMFLFFFKKKIFFIKFSYTEPTLVNKVYLNNVLLIHVTGILIFFLKKFFFTKIKNSFKFFSLVYFFFIMGGWWATQELIWGGWWSWDFLEVWAAWNIIWTTWKWHKHNFTFISSLSSIFVNQLVYFVVLKLNIFWSIHNFINYFFLKKLKVYIVFILACCAPELAISVYLLTLIKSLFFLKIFLFLVIIFVMRKQTPQYLHFMFCTLVLFLYNINYFNYFLLSIFPTFCVGGVLSVVEVKSVYYFSETLYYFPHFFKNISLIFDNYVYLNSAVYLGPLFIGLGFWLSWVFFLIKL